jgi:hypothetical protein
VIQPCHRLACRVRIHHREGSGEADPSSNTIGSVWPVHWQLSQVLRWYRVSNRQCTLPPRQFRCRSRPRICPYRARNIRKRSRRFIHTARRRKAICKRRHSRNLRHLRMIGLIRGLQPAQHRCKQVIQIGIHGVAKPIDLEHKS